MVCPTLTKDVRPGPGQTLMHLKRYLGILTMHDHQHRRSYIRTKYYKGHPKEQEGLEAVEHALSVGAVLMPRDCEICWQTCKPEIADQDLDHPLRFVWVCGKSGKVLKENG